MTTFPATIELVVITLPLVPEKLQRSPFTDVPVLLTILLINLEFVVPIREEFE